MSTDVLHVCGVCLYVGMCGACLYESLCALSSSALFRVCDVRRFAANETKLSPANANRLEVKYIVETFGSVSSTPTVLGDDAYVTDWGGGLHCFSFATGVVCCFQCSLESVNC